MRKATADPSYARRLDEVAANATAATATALIEGWWCKASPGIPFRRANAALPPLGALGGQGFARSSLRSVESWYRSHGVVPRIQVSTADPEWNALDDFLASRGYVIDGPVEVLTARSWTVKERSQRFADRLRMGPNGREVAVTVQPGVDIDWVAGIVRVHGDDQVAQRRTLALGRLFEPAGTSAFGGSVTVARTPVGVAFGVHERGFVGVFGMATAPTWRRRGVAGSLLGAMATGADLLGAPNLYLQVEVGNQPAAHLYRGGLGFDVSHRYHYRVKKEP